MPSVGEIIYHFRMGLRLDTTIQSPLIDTIKRLLGIVSRHIPTYDQRRKMKVQQCLKCGDTVGRPSLKRHQLSAKCRKASLTFQPPTPVRERVAAEQAITPVGVSSLYSTSIPTNPIDSVECPVHGCEYRVSARNDKSKRFSTRSHFRIRHIEDTIVIDQEGQLPQCRLCEFFGTRICASCNPLSSCT
jgi:hypothetical protein